MDNYGSSLPNNMTPEWQDRITQILGQNAPQPPQDPQQEFNSALNQYQSQYGVSQAQRPDLSAADRVSQGIAMGDSKSISLDRQAKLFVGDDSVAYRDMMDFLHNLPHEIDPGNSFQTKTAMAQWAKQSGYNKRQQLAQPQDIAPIPQQLPQQQVTQQRGQQPLNPQQLSIQDMASIASGKGSDYFGRQQEDLKNLANVALLEGKASGGVGGSGGVTQFVYNKTKAALEASGVQVTPQMEQEIISAARNGLPKGSTITVNGQKIAIENILGTTDVLAAQELAKQDASNQSDLSYKPQIAASVKAAENMADMLSKQNIGDVQAMPLIDQLDQLNESTFDTPYANIAQVPAQFLDEYKNQTVAFDLMEQNRTNLAIPLAKALGVNPTDKDFQATLDSIFNIKSSKASRRAQIANLRTRISNRQANNPLNAGSKASQPALRTKVLNGVTYTQDASGNWHK